MNERGKSDNLVVPAKPPNKAGEPVAEVVEGRGLAEGNTDSSTRPGRSAGPGVPSGLDRVREVARRDKEARFTALLHHVDLDRLWAAYAGINPKAAPGIDQVTWDAYGQDLRANLEDLLRRVHSGAYRASPSRRVYIPKPDGRQRPLGIAVLEDKILQRAVVEVLNAVYEEDFLGFSYGFRPGRGPHDALDALAVGITERKVNWILDADVSDFFSRLDHSWMERFLEHRIADKRRQLAADPEMAGRGGRRGWELVGDGRGVTAGGIGLTAARERVSPLRVRLVGPRHWRRRRAQGDMIVVRFADDFVVGFQYLGDAKRFLADLRERFAKFNLELHPDKTRLIEFGRFAAQNRKERGIAKPETFEFLGFTHQCGKTRDGALLAPAHHHQEEAEGEAEAGESRASAAPSLAHPRAGALAGERVEGTLQLLRRARQHRFDHGLPRPDPVAPPRDAPAPEPTPPYDLGAL